MCTNLCVIKRPSAAFWKNTVIPSEVHYVPASKQYSQFLAVVPCGKCVECLKKRQQDISVRAQREAQKRGSMHFVTLTYSDEYLPLAYRLVSNSSLSSPSSSIDLDTGEDRNFSATRFKLCTRCEDPSENLPDDFRLEVISNLNKLAKSSVPRFSYYSVPVGPDLDLVYHYEFTPSLNRRDLRLWIKRCRVYWKREHGEQLDFSYLSCGEMGPRTCRPHYHICFFGLKDEHIRYFCRLWKYGYWNWKPVMCINKDGSSGFLKASRYVSKYVSKGVFECDSVKIGACEKPRLQCSVGLGKDLPLEVISYYRAYDLFGEYDPDKMVFGKYDHDGNFVSSYRRISRLQLESLFQEIRKRSYIYVNGYKAYLPQSIQRKIWYVYEKSKKAYRCTTLRSLLSSSYTDMYLNNMFSKLEDLQANTSTEDLSSALSAFCEMQSVSSFSKAKTLQQDFCRFYSKSIF